LSYTAGYEQVYRNGVLLSRGNDYTATNGTSITLTDATITGDIIEVIGSAVLAIADVYTQAQADANYVGKAIVDAKGDLIAASAADTPARLAVGSNGDTLLADSSTSTGLRWQGDYAAGKNKIINGDFKINQRGFSSTTTSEVFGFDRFFGVFTDGTSTYSAQTFTPGDAPVAGYAGANYARLVSSGQSAANARTLLRYNIESGRTLAGTDITLSFWAQAGSGTPKIAIEVGQNYGSGGSPSSQVNYYLGQATLSTSWQRFSFTYSLPSLSGKTLGTTNDGFVQVSLYVSAGTDFNARTGSLGIQSNTFNIWGLQVEEGSVATAFQTATGTIQGELAACQRYYIRWGGSGAYEAIGLGTGATTTIASIYVNLPVQMRIAPTSVDYSTLGVFDGTTITGSAVPTIVSSYTGTKVVGLDATVSSGLTVNRPYRLITNNSTSGFLGLSAEL
jgi:hypothetical protein